VEAVVNRPLAASRGAFELASVANTRALGRARVVFVEDNYTMYRPALRCFYKPRAHVRFMPGHRVPGPLSVRSPSEARSTFVAMSSGRLPTRPFAPEDDWFVETGGGRSPPAQDEMELRETRPPAPGEGEPRPAGRVREGERSRKLIAGSIVGAGILLVAGALAGALVSRSVAGVETTTSLVTTTATLTTTLTTSTTPSTTPTTTTPSTPTTPATLPEGVVLRRGARGAQVRQVQEALVALGYSTAIDGRFGPATAQAVKSFQTSSGLTDDGIVGPATLSALSAAVTGT
jgi:hypothetical protein